MLRNPDGYTFYEAIVSLACLMIISVTLLPVFVTVKEQKTASGYEATAWQILYETVRSERFRQTFEDYSETREGMTFEVTWKSRASVCASYDDGQQQCLSIQEERVYSD